MTYKYDLYIAYPQSGDVKILQNWTSNMKSFLEILLEKLLKRKINILLSTDKDAKDGKSKAAIHLVLINEQHLDKNFQEEIKSIAELAKDSKYDRVFKIFTSKTDTPALPSSFKTLINYNFYKIDHETGNSINFMELKGEKNEKLYWLKLVDLAYDIYGSLLKITKEKADKEKLKEKTIFLAETGEDQYENRDIIRRELLQYGFNVIPEKHIDLSVKNVSEELKKYLESAVMAIHIIGQDYSQNNEENSICAVQNSFASKYFSELEKANKEKELKRIVWISPDLNLKTEIQKNQIEQLKQDEMALKGAEVVQTPIELLKTVIHNRLHEKASEFSSTSTDSSKNSDKKKIYIINDQQELENVKKISEYFQSKKFDVLETSFTGNEYELIKTHKNKLVNTDLVLIYFNNNNEWLISKTKDIIKSPGFGRKKAYVEKAIFYTENQQININKFISDNFTILKAKNQFEPKTLDLLIKKDK